MFYRFQHANFLWRDLKEDLYNNKNKISKLKEETVILVSIILQDVLKCILLYKKAYLYKIYKIRGMSIFMVF